MTRKCVLALLCHASLVFANDLAIASAHRAQLPKSEWPHHFYVSFAPIPRELRRDVGAALAFAMASNTTQPIIERCLPQHVGGTVYHFDLRNLRWDRTRFRKILEKRHHYGGYQIVIRPDWLIVELTDASESDTHYQLLYGEPPKTRDEFFAAWAVNTTKEHSFGLVEGQSGVSVSGQRWLESFTVPRGYAWGTRDVFQLEKGKDPLEAPDGDFKHDGEEHIVGIAKMSIATGERGSLQAYFLCDGDGKRVDKADPDLVQDHSKFRGNSAIRTSGSCIQCHFAGLNDPTQNLLRDLLARGVRLKTHEQQKAEEIEIFHLSDIGRDIRRANEDFATGVRITNGLDVHANLRAFRRAIAFYDRPVSIEQAARELYSSVRDVRYVLGLQNEVGARLALLAEGEAIPRTVWEQHYEHLKTLLKGIRK